MSYRGKINVKKISFATCKNEALLYCDCCLKEQIEKYISFDCGSQAFFDEVKTLFIQYYPPISDIDFVIYFKR